MRALEEKMILARRIVDRARKANHPRAAAMFERRAQEAERTSSVIREVLLSDEKGGIGEPVNETQDELTIS